jgi:hypothetical protein
MRGQESVFRKIFLLLGSIEVTFKLGQKTSPITPPVTLPENAMKFLPFLSLVLLFVVPHSLQADEPSQQLLPADRPLPEVIDQYLNARLKEAGVTPAPLADDATVLRRLTLDLVGRIPTLAELDEYVASTDPARKSKAVDRLLASPEFAMHQGERFAVLLSSQAKGGGALQDYLQKSFAKNRPWDVLFRELMLPDQTDDSQKGASEFLKTRVKDQDRMVVDVSSTFFGVNISCAQCHNHPHVPNWTQDHFYGMKSFFARTVDNGGFVAEKSFGGINYTPNKGKPKLAPVMFLTGKTIDPPNLNEPSNADKKKDQDRLNQAKKLKKPAPDPDYSLRGKLVELALEPSDEPFFARAIVNRIWYQYFGYGMVMPLDQMHPENFPSHPELMDWLARDMTGHNFDMQRLIRGIVLSDAYARGSRLPSKELPPEPNLFAVARVRALSPMALAKSLRLASRDPQSLPQKQEDVQRELNNLAQSARGLANFFPEPGDKFQVSVEEAMLFSNNEQVQRDLLQGDRTLVSRLLQIKNLNERAGYAVKATLSRTAQSREIEALSKYMQERESRPDEACRQVVWALLTRSEFRVHH